jgi:hypothetical protein
MVQHRIGQAALVVSCGEGEEGGLAASELEHRRAHSCQHDQHYKGELSSAWRGDSGGGSTVRYAIDPRVDAYIEALPEWQRAICHEVRDLVHAADRDVTETIKRTHQPYFVLQGNICALLAAKDHVNVFLYDGAIVADPDGIITAGHENKTARTVAIGKGAPMNAPALAAMFKQIIANNRAGGWRKLKREIVQPE